VIGNYLLSLTPEQEDLVLTTPMSPGAFNRRDSGYGSCLLGTAYLNDSRGLTEFCCSRRSRNGYARSITGPYDNLCERFGTARINAAIRTRILSNRAWRVLAMKHEPADHQPTQEPDLAHRGATGTVEYQYPTAGDLEANRQRAIEALQSCPQAVRVNTVRREERV
jgi:hypothetical protein